MDQILDLAKNNWEQIQEKFQGLEEEDKEGMIEHFNSFDGELSLGNALFGDDPDYDEFRDSAIQLKEDRHEEFVKHWNDAFEDE